MINKLNDANSISLTTDCWASVQNFSYIAITAHLLDSNFKISSFCLAVRHILGGQFATNLASNLKKGMSEFKIEDKVKHIVTDNAYNITTAIENLGVKNFRCFGHILHLIVTTTFKAIRNESKFDVDKTAGITVVV